MRLTTPHIRIAAAQGQGYMTFTRTADKTPRIELIQRLPFAVLNLRREIVHFSSILHFQMQQSVIQLLGTGLSPGINREQFQKFTPVSSKCTGCLIDKILLKEMLF